MPEGTVRSLLLGIISCHKWAEPGRCPCCNCRPYGRRSVARGEGTCDLRRIERLCSSRAERARRRIADRSQTRPKWVMCAPFSDLYGRVWVETDEQPREAATANRVCATPERSVRRAGRKCLESQRSEVFRERVV